MVDGDRNASISPSQNCHAQTASDFHPLPPVQCYRGVVIGKYVQERNLASRRNLASNRSEQYLRVTAAAVSRMHADRRYLGIIGGLHSLSGHGDELPI